MIRRRSIGMLARGLKPALDAQFLNFGTVDASNIGKANPLRPLLRLASPISWVEKQYEIGKPVIGSQPIRLRV